MYMHNLMGAKYRNGLGFRVLMIILIIRSIKLILLEKMRNAITPSPHMRHVDSLC